MRFPLSFIPKESWHERPRCFGAPRSGTTRLHGACDLYGPLGTPVYAIEGGIVGPVLGYPPSTPNPYPFYKGTEALELRSTAGIWRYCELEFVPEIRIGHLIKEGDLLGHIGDMRLGIWMLHLELYRGDSPGALTQRGQGLYDRRPDLLDPTELIDRLAREWEPKPLAAASAGVRG